MIFRDIKLFSQNVQKNSLIVKTILKVKSEFNIIFIQESSWATICFISSSTNCKGDDMVSVINHSNWLTFARNPINKSKCPKVAIYVNIRLSLFYFSLCRDIIDFRDILLVSFFNNNNIFQLMNVYSDSLHSTLKYLKNTKVNIRNLLIMTGDFNI